MTPHATGLDPAQVCSLVKCIHSHFSFPANGDPKSIEIGKSGDPQLEYGAFLEAVQAHRVATLVDDCSSALGLAEPVAQQLHALAINDALLAMTLAKETVKAWSLLDSAGVAALAFKGVALSVQTTGTVTARGNGDVDLLVRPVDVLSAVRVLMAGGWQLAEISPARLEREWRRIAWSGRELVMTGPRSQIDLHWQLAKERGLLPTADELLARSTHIELLNDRITTFAPSDALLAACYHLSHDGFRSLRQCVDVIRLLRLQDEVVNWSGDERRMGLEAANFAVHLLGGVTKERLAAIGIPWQETPHADRRWAQFQCHPEFGYRRPGLPGLLDRIADNTRYGSAAVEVARRGVLRLATGSGSNA